MWHLSSRKIWAELGNLRTIPLPSWFQVTDVESKWEIHLYIEAELRFHLNPALGCSPKPLRCECCVYKLVVNASDSVLHKVTVHGCGPRMESWAAHFTRNHWWEMSTFYDLLQTLVERKYGFVLVFFFGFLIALSPTWHILLPNVFLTFSLTHNLQVLFQFKIIRDNNFNTLCCLTPRLWHGTMQFILVSQISIYLLLYLQIHIW